MTPGEARQVDLEARITWTSYGGIRILREDFSDLSEDDILTLMDHLAGVLLAEREGSVRELIVVRGISVSRRLLDAAIQLSERCDDHVMRTAVVGVTGVKKLILKMYNRFAGSPMVPFDAEVEAMAWLIRP